VGAAPQDELGWAVDAPPTTTTYCAASATPAKKTGVVANRDWSAMESSVVQQEEGTGPTENVDT
jgi:hypothetical protein